MLCPSSHGHKTKLMQQQETGIHAAFILTTLKQSKDLLQQYSTTFQEANTSNSLNIMSLRQVFIWGIDSYML
jgi:hypothetical protein